METAAPTIPGQYGGEPVFGDICPSPEGQIGTAEHRYLMDSAGNQTRYVRRVKGRPVQDIAADIAKAIRRYRYEWAILGQGYKYKQGTDSPESECPDHNGLAVYVTHGGSEGHLVHVDLQIAVPHEATYMIHKKLFMVKTFGGSAHAQRIALKLQKVLGVL